MARDELRPIIKLRSTAGTGTTYERQVATAIKNAREMALLPYTSTGK